MSKVAVVYWSGTGNTEAMAMTVAEGAKGKGAEVSVIPAAEFTEEQIGNYGAIAFGCPSMGAEQLEESEFEPMFAACEGRLSGKNIALFGSYGWGDGEWMRSWESRCDDAGANMVCDSVICNETPTTRLSRPAANWERRWPDEHTPQKAGDKPLVSRLLSVPRTAQAKPV